MKIAILLILALILVYFIKPKDKQSYHKTILAIFGIAYFCIWRFLDFYFDIFTPVEIDKNTAFVSLMVITLIIGFLPWITRTTEIQSYAFVALFVLSIFLTFMFENNIKNVIAERGGYYNDSEYAFTDNTEKKKLNKFYYEAGGFSVEIPDSWEKQKNELGMIYFTKQKNNTKMAEFRPSCFHNSEFTMPEIINNIIETSLLQGFKTEKHCSIKNNSLLTCFIRNSDNKESESHERWRLLTMNIEQGQNMELDFVFEKNSVINKQVASSIISSFKSTALTEPLPFCARSANWF